jgi:hypothetical protein
MKSDHDGAGLEVEPVNDNIYHWRVRLSHFPASSQMHRDMAILDSKYGIGIHHLSSFILHHYEHTVCVGSPPALSHTK